MNFDHSLPPWAFPAPCGYHIPVLDPRTDFLSECFLATFDAAISLLLIVPVLVAGAGLSVQNRGQSSIRGRTASLAASLVPLLRLSVYFIDGVDPKAPEWLVIFTGVAIAWLHFVQDGRVLVARSELLLYWLSSVPSAIGLAVDAYLREKPSCVVAIAIALLGATAFVAELRRTLAPGEKSYEKANIFEKASISYLTDLLDKSSKEQVRREDLPEPVRGLNSYNSYHQLSSTLESFKSENRFLLLFGLFNLMKGDLLAMIVLDALAQILTYASPFVLSLFLSVLAKYSQGEAPLFHAVYYAIVIGVLPLLATAAENLCSLINATIAVRGRAALLGLIYRKTIRLAPQARELYDTGKVMTLVNMDSDIVTSFLFMLPQFFSAPLAIVISTWQLYLFIGKSMLAALPIYISLGVLSALTLAIFIPLFIKLMAVHDSLSKATSNAFRNIKSVKLYAWEQSLTERIGTLRQQELGIWRKALVGISFLTGIWEPASDLVGLAILVVFLRSGKGVLSPEVVFPVLSLVGKLTIPFAVLSSCVGMVGQLLASLKRMNELLGQDEQDYANITWLPSYSGYKSDTVVFESVTASWTSESTEEKVALKNASWSAGNGDLVCLVGKVGSGKTAMLKALCGEIKTISGNISISGDIAYCPQEAWLENKTVRENILFGRHFEESFYSEVVRACDLDKDVSSFPLGDLTEVGERGITLSGGQKARLALARAVYAQAGIYVLDDVLSAVDEHVSAHLVANLLGKDGLLASKTIILATNNIKVLSQASQIIALRDGKVVEQGTLEDVLKQKENSETYKLIHEFGSTKSLTSAATTQRRNHVSANAVSPTQPRFSESLPSLLSGQELEEEDTVSDYRIFKRYFKYAGFTKVGIALGIILLSVLAINLVSIWLGKMSNRQFGSWQDAKGYVTVYIILILFSSSTLVLGFYVCSAVVAVSASTKLYKAMLHSTLRGKMSMFDSTPLGRLLNRFTKDVSRVDEDLPQNINSFTQSLLSVVGAAVIMIVGAPFVIIVAVPTVFITNYYRRIYIPGSRQITRMTAAANSPILSHIEESVKGAAVLRSFGALERYEYNLDHRVDYWIELSLIRRATSRWLEWRLNGLTSALALSSALTIVVLTAHNLLSVGMAGVVLYNTFRVGFMTKMSLTNWASLELSGISLDRLFEYIDNEQEAPAHIEETKPADSWPAKGVIHFEEYSARYKDDGEDVLKKLSFSVNARERIGIVGRTGSGKSTLTLGLFRLVEASGGSIDIDSVNTAELGLYDLRSKLAIIPQDAQIFEGTLRENLDAIGLVDDERLWQILELCHLKEHFEKLGTGLETMLTEGGENLSRGQAQLICLGRALVHDTKVLVLDEATASVDVETDKILQQTIRNEFKDRTILTIAHRLNTILDSDRILVLDNGELVEFDAPSKLLEAKGHFWKLHQTMVSESQ